MKDRVVTLRTPHNVLFAYIVALTGGIIASALLANNSDWMKWHFSFLGEGDSISAHIFNLTMVICGVIIWLFSQSIVDVARHTYSHRPSIRRDTTIYLNVYRVISVCMMGIGVFPRDVNLLAHDMSGYVAYILYSLLVLVSAFLAKILALKTRVFAFASVVVVTVMWVIQYSNQNNLLPLTIVELTGGILLMIWHWLIANEITRTTP
jgi:hypothetical membrane protein